MFLPKLMPSLKVNLHSVEHICLGSWWRYQHVSSPFTRLYYVASGSGTFLEYGGERYEMTAGRMVISPPFTPVNYYCEDLCDVYGIIFSAELTSGLELFTLQEMKRNELADRFFPDLFERLVELNPGTEIRIKDPFHQAYNDMIRNLESETQDYRSLMETEFILKLILSRFVSEPKKEAAVNNSVSHDRIITILQYIEDHIAESLPLDRLAEQVALNPVYFSNLFTEILKVRPTIYIRKKRLEKAQLLLVSTNRPLKQIAFEVGIENPDYFFRIFKKDVGCTPSEYREKYA